MDEIVCVERMGSEFAQVLEHVALVLVCDDDVRAPRPIRITAGAERDDFDLVIACQRIDFIFDVSLRHLGIGRDEHHDASLHEGSGATGREATAGLV